MFTRKTKLIIMMIVGYIVFILGFISFTIFGTAISFIGGMITLIPLLYLGITIFNKKKFLSILLISISIIGFFAMIINFIIVISVMNRQV